MSAPFLNAKQINYKAPGSVAAHYGWTDKNILKTIGRYTGTGTKNARNVQSHIDKFLGKRGYNLKNSSSKLQISALDYAFREEARGQQTKKSFFDKPFGKILGIGATALGGVLGGPAGGALVGGAFGGASGGWKGGLLGALGGYAGAGALSKFGAPTNLLNVPNPLAGGVSQLGGSLGGTVSNVNSFMPNWAQSGAAAGAAGGGSGVGVFNALSGFMNNNQWVGQLASAGLNFAGSRQASNQMTQAADRAFQSSQFQPYNISGPQGGASFNGRNATGHLSPEMQRVAKDQLGVAKGALRGYNRFNPDKFANEAYRTMANYVEPQNTQDTNEYLSDIYNTGAWGSTTGARDIFSLQRARQAEDNMFRLQSQQLGAAESDRLFNNYFKSIGSYANTLGIPYGMINQGMGGGAQASAANANANQFPWFAARNSADASAAFWSSMGSVVQNYGNSRNRYQAGLYQQRGSSVTPQMPGNNSTPWW